MEGDTRVVSEDQEKIEMTREAEARHPHHRATHPDLLLLLLSYQGPWKGFQSGHQV